MSIPRGYLRERTENCALGGASDRLVESPERVEASMMKENPLFERRVEEVRQLR